MEDLSSALSDFHRARSRASLEEIVARITGDSVELLSYEAVRNSLRASGVAGRRVSDIPLDSIVGSVGRYRDFTRTFLPRQESDAGRWAGVKVATSKLEGLPPVELYQIGEAYFVRDGHHRVSVARQLGAPTIEAYVTEIRTEVPLPADVQPDELILKAEYADFQEATGLGQLRPDADMGVSVAGQYGKLLEHIEVHRHYLGIEQEREIPYREAVEHWYDAVYAPVVGIIRELGILHHFPGRAETDLYLWIGEHRAHLEQAYGWEIPESAAAADLASQKGTGLISAVARLGKKVIDVVLPDELETGPGPGSWRREREADERAHRLFGAILLPLSGRESGWAALEAAIGIARREGSEIRGLYVGQDREDDYVAIRDRFDWRMNEEGISGQFQVEQGGVARTICQLARWTDLVVAGLSHPPGESVISRLSSGFRTMLQRCSRPVLAVPGEPASLSRPLLAFDGSAKAIEALYVAAYVAERWRLPLLVAAIGQTEADQALTYSRQYLEANGVAATYIADEGEPASELLSLAADHGCDWLIMGGYGTRPVAEVVLGSVVDQVLRASKNPVMICR